jgi:putative lipoic acid-binding regulatory protein
MDIKLLQENEKKIDFPAAITFKAIFKNKPYIVDSIKTVLSENGITGDILLKESKEGKFISYTINAYFPSNNILESICSKISSLDGFMTMF